MRICGVDPGLEISGYAVLESADGRFRIVDAGICRSSPRMTLERRLAQIEADFQDVLGTTRPDVVAIEQLYAHYKHPRTAILMGHARGVMLAVAARLGIELRHYNATQVKRYLTGNGRAPKSQVQRAVAVTLGLPRPPEPPDVADALAIALCCGHQIQHEAHAQPLPRR
jgi:crossover junction endodeoxyribonuclease RuvC